MSGLEMEHKLPADIDLHLLEGQKKSHEDDLGHPHVEEAREDSLASLSRDGLHQFLSDNDLVGILMLWELDKGHSPVLNICVPLVLAVQLILPSVLLWYTLDKNASVCAADGTIQQRLTMACICALYFTRVLRKCARLWKMLYRNGTRLPFRPKHADTMTQELLDSAVFNTLFPALDLFMVTTYELAMAILNVVIVYTEYDPFNMVIHSISIQFISSLDNELKEHYVKAHRTATKNLFKSQEYLKPKTNAFLPARITLTVTRYIGMFATLVTPVILFVAIPGFAYCKAQSA